MFIQCTVYFMYRSYCFKSFRSKCFFLFSDHVLSLIVVWHRQCGNQKTTIIWTNRSSKWTLDKERRIETKSFPKMCIDILWMKNIFRIENGHIWNKHRKERRRRRKRSKNDKWFSFVYFIHHYLWFNIGTECWAFKICLLWIWLFLDLLFPANTYY